MFGPRRLRAALIALAVSAGLVAVTQPAQAATVTFGAVADTFVNGGSATQSFGTQTTMRADDGNPKIAYVEFTVSGIPAGATDVSATLHLFATQGDPVALDVHTVAPSAWSEATTYGTRPPLGAKVATVTAQAGPVSVPVPVAGNGMVSLALVRTGSGVDTILATREAATVSTRPTLVVTYADAPPPPPPPPTPPPTSGGYDVLGVTDAYIDSLPTAGADWTELLAMADGAYTVDIADGALDGSGNAVAGALVYLRTGNTAYLNKVNAALNAVQATSPAAWWHAAANRKIGGWVAAAQLVGKPARNPDGSLNAWGQWLSTQLTVTHGGPGRSAVMLDAARGWDNNHGAAARQSVAAIEAYLDLPLTTSCNAMKAWLGGTHPGYAFVASNSPTAGQLGWSPDEPSWYDPQHYAGINPSAAWAGHPVPALMDGAITGDVHRDGAAYPTIGASGADHYIFGNLYREVAAMVTLAANGCPLWTYADDAMRRARVWAANNIPDHDGDYLGNADAALNAVYGLTYPDGVGAGENFLVASGWLAPGGAWPAR